MKNYYNDLINRIFNILYLYEKNKDSFETYLFSIIEELKGNNDFKEIQQIRFRLNSLNCKNCSHSDVRRVVLKSVNMIDKIVKNWKE